MSKIHFIGIVAALGVFLLASQRPLVRVPKMSRLSGDALLVGEAGGTGARFVIGQREEFSAVCMGYDMSFFGGGLLSEAGSRAVLHYLGEASYAKVQEIQKCGQCAAGFLNQCEASGRLGHLLLVPASEQALDKMKKVTLKPGARFRLAGSVLALQSGQIDGRPFNVNLGTTQFFLVESLELH